MDPIDFAREAVALARANIDAGGRPFGAVVVLGGRVVGRGINDIAALGDPTAHAELQAIRAACRALGVVRLEGAEVYASGHPCPMCLALMHMTGVRAGFYAYDNVESVPFGLSTADVYAQMTLPPEAQRVPLRKLRPEGEAGLYDAWKARG